MPIRFDHQLTPHFSPLQERAIKEAYLALYTFAGAKKEDHLVFNSSGSEGVNHAIFAAYLDITRKTGKNHFLCSALDEAPTIMAMGRLQEVGSLFQMVPATFQGVVTPKEVAEMITPRTAMLSMSWANGLTGVIQPISEIAELCRERGILFHIDATHVLGKGDFAFETSGADVLTFNGPMGGTGFLLIRSGVELSPLILGGEQQGRMRGGAVPFSALVEMAKWANEERSYIDHYGIETARLRSLFEEIVSTKVQNARPLFQHENRLPHISNILFPGVASDALYYFLLQKGVYTTFGGGQFQHLSHLLKACGLKEPETHCGLSFSFTHAMEEEEIREGARIVSEGVLHLQKYSIHLMSEVS